mgnify:CR=1 FL=1
MMELHDFPGLTISACQLRPESRGSITLASRDPREKARIQANYLSTPEDRQVAADSLRLTRRIAAQPALARYKPQEVKPGPQYQSDEDLARLAGDIGTTIFHPVGTCRMGKPGEAGAVVDSRLRVRGVERLRVCDLSSMPDINSGNTAAPAMMMGSRCAAFIGEAAA